MTKIVLEMVPVVFQRIERFVFDAPARPSSLHEAIHCGLVDPQVGDPAEVLDFTLERFPALDEIDPHSGVGCIEGHVTGKAKAMVSARFTIFTFIIGDPSSLLGLGHVLESKRLIAFFDTHEGMDVMRLPHLDVRGIGTAAVFGDNHVEVRVVLTELGNEAFGRIALAIIFARAVLFDNGLRQQRDDFALLGMQEGCPQPLMRRGHGAVSLLFLSTRRTVNLVGGKRARAIEGQERVPLHKHPLLEHLASLELTKDVLEGRPQGLGLNGIEDLAYRGIARHALDALDPVQVVLSSLFVKGEQSRGVE
jgi:hypothetical protein